MQLTIDSSRARHLRWALCCALLIVAAIPSTNWIVSRAEATASPTLLPGDGSTHLPVAALGRIEPRDGLLEIAAPASEMGHAIVTALHVRQGDWVEPGQVLAELRGRDELEAALIARQRKVAIAQARVLALKAGGKEDDIRALRSEIESDKATVAQIEADTRRAQQLHEDRVLSDAAMQAQRSRLAVATRSLDAKRARLNGLSNVRPADLAVADAEMHAAEADVDEARARLESTWVRAPAAGRVLAIYAYPGQSVGTKGLLAFGKTAEMFVDAEVMEEDLPRMSVGQSARITGDVLPMATAGVVEEIGYLIGSRDVFRTDPTAFADSRVIHVKIRATEPAKLERFINARVTVEIQP